MARVICTLPNASDCISGVPFVADDRDGVRQMISAGEVPADVLETFASIPGYIVVESGPAQPPAAPKPGSAAAKAKAKADAEAAEAAAAAAAAEAAAAAAGGGGQPDDPQAAPGAAQTQE